MFNKTSSVNYIIISNYSFSSNENFSINKLYLAKKSRWFKSKSSSSEITSIISGINNIFWLGEFEDILKEVLSQADFVYINTNEHYRQNVQTQTREDRFINRLKNINGLKFKKSNPILQKQRSVKDQIEIELIKNACEITKKGFERVLNFIKPKG